LPLVIFWTFTYPPVAPVGTAAPVEVIETAPPLKAEEPSPPFVVILPPMVISLPALAVNDAPEAVALLVSIAPTTVMVVFGADNPRA